jgi:ectoine hydroxylase-related dioxygenase (phytanoyl-CoA dioxygenase family)
MEIFMVSNSVSQTVITSSMVALYKQHGHLTVPNVFEPSRMQKAIEDIEQWGEEFLLSLPTDQRKWYVDQSVLSKTVLRKLDNPHAHREYLFKLATDSQLVSLVQSLIGGDISIYFSQIFFKPPEGGGPKPAHQDNFYFGPNDPNGLVTAWIALDDATLENGCLYYGDGTNLGPVYEHFAPADEPFNLQLPTQILDLQPMTPAPVLSGGVSFHHGNTFHASGSNRSKAWRRACAFHYVRNDVFFERPALAYDHSLIRRIT